MLRSYSKERVKKKRRNDGRVFRVMTSTLIWMILIAKIYQAHRKPLSHQLFLLCFHPSRSL